MSLNNYMKPTNTTQLKPLWITAQKATPKKTFSAQKERGN